MQDTDFTRRMAKVERIAKWMDGKFKIPGTNFKFGLDALIGLLPVAGDTVSLMPQLYLVYQAARLKAPTGLIIKMLFTVIFDWLAGSIPVVGDIYDFFFKSSQRNADRLKKHFENL